MKKITNFFLFSSGVDLQILEQCPTDKSKYVGIGGTVFFTGLLAAIAAGYALYTIFDNYFIAIVLGQIWGIMIFNLDRFIVSSMRKEERFTRELITAMPRLILALIISLVIAKPLELKIFNKEIEPELVLMEQQVNTAQEAAIQSRFEPAIAQLRTDIQNLKNEIAEKAIQRDQMVALAQQEADGTGGSKIKNLGPIYKVKKADAERSELELQQLTKTNNEKISSLYSQSSLLERSMNEAIAGLEHTKINGPAARIEALQQLTTKNSAMWWAHLFILLLFLMLESAPIMVKLFSKKGPYDSVLRTREHEYICREIESIAATTDETKKRAAKLSSMEQEYVARKLDAELS